MDILLKEVSGTRRYFKILNIQSFFALVAVSFYTFALGFYTALPKYECLKDGEYIVFTEVEACKNLSICKPASYSYPSWVQIYDMTGEKRKERNNILFLSLVLSTFTFFVLSALADTYGRKKLMYIATIGIMFGVTSIYYVDSFLLKCLLYGFSGGGDGTFATLFTILGKESSTKGSTAPSLLVNILLVGGSVGSITLGIMTFFVPNAENLALSGVVIVMIGFTGNFIFFIEPPMYGYKNRDRKGLKKSLKYIATINSVQLKETDLDEKISFAFAVLDCSPNSNIDVDVSVDEQAFSDYKSTIQSVAITLDSNPSLNFDDKNYILNIKKSLITEKLLSVNTDSKSKQNRNSIKDSTKLVFKLKLFFSWKYLLSTIAFSALGAGVYLVYYGGALTIDRAGLDNLRINEILLGVSSLLGYMISIPIIKNSKRKLGSVLGMIGMVIGAAILYFVMKELGNTSLSKIIQSCVSIGVLNTLLSVLFSFLFVYSSEVFPVLIRSVGMGASLFIGKLAGASASYVTAFTDDLGLHPMIGGVCPAIPAVIFVLLWLPETKRVSPQNILKE